MFPPEAPRTGGLELETASLPPLRFDPDERPAAVPIWREALVGLDWLALRASPVFYGRGTERGDGAPVVVVPGFLGSDRYLFELYGWLGRIGYRPYLSRIGRNAECLDLLVARLGATVDQARAETDRRVHLIGHSLGGVLSRVVAARRPEGIASVITLGSPFRGLRSHPLVIRAAAAVRARLHRQGRRPKCFTTACDCDSVGALGTQLPVPQIAVYTKTDGIVDWRACVNDDPEADFEVSGTHVGLVFNAAVYRLIAARLAGIPSAPARACL
jgi:pimeloyl-ACP methyl ester carboxylesterase